MLLHSFSHFFCQTTLIDHGFFIFHFFFFPQAVRAFLSVQLDEIWHTSVEGVVIALLTNIIEINVNTVDWKNASRWAWDVRVNFILKLYFFFLVSSKQICHQIESKKYCGKWPCTEVHFASFLSSRFTTMVVINQPERILAKRNSVQCYDKMFF